MAKMRARFFALLVLLSALSQPLVADNPVRIHQRLDSNWRFLLDDPKDGQDPTLDSDSKWRVVTVPHDWSVEGNFDAKNPMGGGGGFLPSGIGWYRQTLDVPSDWIEKKKVVWVEFEGVYMNADVWCNGQQLATHPYGYTGFNVDLTAALKVGKNLLAVRVDNSQQKNSRWYSGSGIYRHVWLTVTDPVHIEPWGVFVTTTAASATSATVTAQMTVTPDPDPSPTADKTLNYQFQILGPTGTDLNASETSVNANHESTENGSTTMTRIQTTEGLEIKNPPLWSPEHPQMCTLVCRVLNKEGHVLDEVQQPFGLRTLKWSAANGLQINGVTYKLNGGCVHHDNGVLGACAYDRAEERRVEILKASGFDEIRTSHNPPSPEFLDACDRNGLLVMEEAFDCWEKGKNKFDYSVVFKDQWKNDLTSMIMRDRNHPSVVFWSIGNEIPGIYDDWGPDLQKNMVALIHGIDTTRPVTNGILGWPKEGDAKGQAAAESLWSSLDITGTNYSLSRHVNQHDKFPDRIIVGTESSPGNPANGYNLVTTNPYVAGDNVWTALDYLGESGLGRWFYQGDPAEPLKAPKDANDTQPHPIGHGDDRLFPWHGANCGDIDILGDRKPMAHWRNIVWNKGEKLYMAVQQPQSQKIPIIVAGWGWIPTWESWTWPGWEGEQVTVEVYTRYPKIRLTVNKMVAGEKELKDIKDFRALITIPYLPGTLRVAGLDEKGNEVESCELDTAGEPASIRLTPDRKRIKADGQDLCYVQVEVLDPSGHVQPNADEDIAFTVTGQGIIAGLGNADMKSTASYQGTHCQVFHGKALVVLRASSAGAISLTATSAGLIAGKAHLVSQ